MHVRNKKRYFVFKIFVNKKGQNLKKKRKGFLLKNKFAKINKRKNFCICFPSKTKINANTVNGDNLFKIHIGFGKFKNKKVYVFLKTKLKLRRGLVD